MLYFCKHFFLQLLFSNYYKTVSKLLKFEKKKNKNLEMT